MNKKLLYSLLTLFLAVSTGAWAGTETIVLSEQGYENAEKVTSTSGTNFTLTYNKGTSTDAPAYYNAGTGVRVYAGGNIVISSEKTMTKVVVTFAKEKSPNLSFDGSAMGSSPYTWEGSAVSLQIDVESKGHIRLQKVEVTYVDDESDTTVPVATVNGITPTEIVSGAEGTFTLNATFAEGTVEGEDYEVAWSSDNEDVVLVDEKTGEYTAGEVGKAKISIHITVLDDETYKEVDYSVYVTVTDARQEAGISYSETGVTVNYKEGQTYTLPELDNPNDLASITFASSKEDVAKVDDEGNVTLTGVVGTATITASFDGDDNYKPATASYTITVVVPGRAHAYKKVTSTADLTNGNYLIVYGGDNTHPSVAFNGSLDKLDAANDGFDVDIVNDIIVTDADSYFTLDVTAGLLQSAKGLYIGVSKDSNGLKQSESADYTNTFSIDEDGNAVILSYNNTMPLRYNYAKDQNRFRYYKSGQQPIQLYKEYTPSEEELTVEITSAGAVSFSSIYPIDLSSQPNVKAYIVTAKNASSFARQEVTGILPANTGVVLEGNEAKYYFEMAESLGDPIDGNLLVATSKGAFTANADDYGFVYGLFQSAVSGKIGFQKKKEGWTCAANKCYLRLTETSAANVIFFDTVDAINTVNADVNAVKGQTYNLSGQKVNADYRGIIIRDGHKMIQR